jgi:hypothetical protein
LSRMGFIRPALVQRINHNDRWDYGQFLAVVLEYALDQALKVQSNISVSETWPVQESNHGGLDSGMKFGKVESYGSPETSGIFQNGIATLEEERGTQPVLLRQFGDETGNDRRFSRTRTSADPDNIRKRVAVAPDVCRFVRSAPNQSRVIRWRTFQPDIDLREDALASSGHTSRDIVPAAYGWFQHLEGLVIGNVLVDCDVLISTDNVER